MNPLKLTLLPSTRQNEESGSLQMEREGFVDEAAVLALLTGPTHPRSSSYPQDLALSADDLDFAGWQIQTTPVARPSEFPPHVIDAIVRRATSHDEPGIGSPHSGSHRWWLAGMAGVFSTLLFSVLIASLTSRPEPQVQAAQSSEITKIPQSVTPPKTNTAPEVSSELTDASILRH